MSSHANPVSWQEFSEALLTDSARSLRVAILAAHPDDETIGASEVLTRCGHTSVIYLTDGAPRDNCLWSPEFRGTREEYARLRKEEAEQALQQACGSFPHWLGATDQESIFSVHAVLPTLRTLLHTLRPDVLVTHPYEGGHPDHDTAALIGRVMLAELGSAPAPLLVEMTSYHARNAQFVSGEFLEGTGAAGVCIELSQVDRERKKKMFAAYKSQKEVLSAFNCDQEWFRAAPVYNFSRPPHDGTLWYERLGWPMRGEQWRALARAQECACV